MAFGVSQSFLKQAFKKELGSTASRPRPKPPAKRASKEKNLAEVEKIVLSEKLTDRVDKGLEEQGAGSGSSNHMDKVKHIYGVYMGSLVAMLRPGPFKPAMATATCKEDAAAIWKADAATVYDKVDDWILNDEIGGLRKDVRAKDKNAFLDQFLSMAEMLQSELHLSQAKRETRAPVVPGIIDEPDSDTDVEEEAETCADILHGEAMAHRPMNDSDGEEQEAGEAAKAAPGASKGAAVTDPPVARPSAKISEGFTRVHVRDSSDESSDESSDSEDESSDEEGAAVAQKAPRRTVGGKQPLPRPTHGGKQPKPGYGGRIAATKAPAGPAEPMEEDADSSDLSDSGSDEDDSAEAALPAEEPAATRPSRIRQAPSRWSNDELSTANLGGNKEGYSQLKRKRG